MTTQKGRDAQRRYAERVAQISSGAATITPDDYLALLDDADECAELAAVAEAAMHVLLHVDADMEERIEAAKAVAEATGHAWPPYDFSEGEEGDEG